MKPKEPTQAEAALEDLYRGLAALLYGDSYDTPVPRFTNPGQVLYLLKDRVRPVRVMEKIR